DSVEEHHAKLVAGESEYAGSNPEDPDEYRAENIFWVHPAARWTYLQNSAKQPTIGKIVDDAMVAIERDNPRLRGILPKDYARPALDKNRLGELIDLIGTIGLGEKENRSKDILGRVYEYFLSRKAGWLISGQTLRVRIPDWTRLHLRYLAQLYLDTQFIAMVESHSLGTTRPSLNTSLLRDFSFLLPPAQLTVQFAKAVSAGDECRQLLQQQ